MKKLIMLTNYKNLIPQRNHEIEGLKLNDITKVLEKNNFEVTIVSINKFVKSMNKKENLNGIFFFYTSSQYPIYKSYIQDILIQIQLRGGILIPEFRHFLAHENKNFQELEKIRLGIKSPHGIPVGTYEEGVSILKEGTFPKVIKKATGFRSRNVRLANNMDEGKILLKRMLDNNLTSNIESLYYIYRRFKNQQHYPKRFGKLIIQDFIPNLEHDWKILVLGNRCLGGKRLVRKNDFRASGSKLYAMEEDPTEEVLNFALECKQKLKCPVASFDISEKDGALNLLEYQTMHFSLLGGDPNFYFELVDKKWKKIKIEHEMEHYIGIAINQYINDLATNNL